MNISQKIKINFNNYIFEGEDYSIKNPFLKTARQNNYQENFDYEKKLLEDKKKKLFELANNLKTKD